MQGQSITTLVERAIDAAASSVTLGSSFSESEKSWANFWDPSEGIRTLQLIADSDYPTNYEEDDLLSFTRVHWPFFYTTEKYSFPRRAFIDLLWPKIDVYLDLWRTQRNANYWAAGEAMRSDLTAARVEPPSWPIDRKASPPPAGPRESFAADLDDEIPF